MEKWVSGLEETLPDWLDKSQTQWVQWAYAIWQLVRCNPVILLLLSYLPFMLRQYLSKKHVIVLGDSREYYMEGDEIREYFRRGPFISKKLEQIAIHLEEDRPDYPNRYTVKYKDNYYITQINTLGDLRKIEENFGEDVIFVEKLVKVSEAIAVGKELSETEAYEKILSKRFKCSKGPTLVVPTWFNYAEFSSKFWVVMSSLPILLQANNYGRISNLLSLMIILLDLNRGRLYRLYDRAFNSFAKVVKLSVFKNRTGMYDFFSIFSKRWGYTDTAKKCAYVVERGGRLKIWFYSKLEKPDDVKIVGWERYRKDPNVKHVFMEIDKGEAHCSLMTYDGLYAEVELGRPVYVC